MKRQTLKALFRTVIIWLVFLVLATQAAGCSVQKSGEEASRPSARPTPILYEHEASSSSSANSVTNSAMSEVAAGPESASPTCLTGLLSCEDFESDTLVRWRQASPKGLRLLAGTGSRDSTALAVTGDMQPSYLYQEDLARAKEAYLTFSFDPNGVNFPTVGEVQKDAVRIASVTGPYGVLVALRVYRSEDKGYKAYLEWSDKNNRLQLDNDSGQFDLEDGWQRLRIGYQVDKRIAVWVNDELRRERDVTHADTYGTGIALGWLNEVDDVQLNGTMLFDDVGFEVPHADDLWVDAKVGDDANTGQSAEQAFRTIQRAADVAGPGTTVHILPGIYREGVVPAMSGTSAERVIYRAENGPGTAIVRGSEPTSSLTWTQLIGDDIGLPAGVDPSNIYYTDLSSWGLESPPHFVVELDGGGNVVSRLLPAREPDWQVQTEWKVHEYWWFANGGSAVAGCDPTTDPDPQCDYSWRSFTQLTDTNNDTDPADIEPGNLTTLGNLTGATLVAMDSYHAHYVYHQTIIAHDVAAGRVTVDEDCDNDGAPGLGWGSKYYIENHPALLDQPGEWWFDENSNRFYLWSPTGENPATLNLEISRLDYGFDLTNRSFTSLDGMTVELFSGDAYRINNANPWNKAHGNSLSKVTLRYANRGVFLYQYVSGETPEPYAIDGFLLEDSEVAQMDTVGIYLTSWWTDAPTPDQFSHAGVRNTVIRNNELHHLGYESEYPTASGVRVFFPDKIRFEGNYIHHVAHNGAHFHLSLVDSPNEYAFTPQEIKLGVILIKDNIFEDACQLGSDCGALKFGGDRRPYTHVFRDVLVTGNILRNTYGWSYVSAKRGLNAVGDGNGFYLDRASGIHAYRNIAYDNTGAGFKLSCLWRDGDIIFYNNIAANNYREGFKFTGDGSSCDDHNGSVNTQFVNNILVGNDAFGIQFVSGYEDDNYGNLTIDHNLYYNNGWNEEAAWEPADIQLFQGSRPTQYFHGLAEIQDRTPWEDHGVEGDPSFFDYDPADHDLYDGSWPDFHLTTDSANALDRGTAALPDSLIALLERFGVTDFRRGQAYDIGRYEGGFTLLASPGVQFVSPGGAVQYALRLDPPDLPHPVTMTASSPSPLLGISLSSPILMADEVATLTVTDSHAEPTIVPGLEYTIPITTVGGGFADRTSIRLYVGGEDIYLPFILQDSVWD
jgi:hypothetical protein